MSTTLRLIAAAQMFITFGVSQVSASPIEELRESFAAAKAACSDAYDGPSASMYGNMCESTCRYTGDDLAKAPTVTDLGDTAKNGLANCAKIMRIAKNPPPAFTEFLTLQSNFANGEWPGEANASATASVASAPAKRPTYADDMKTVMELSRADAVSKFTFAEARDRVKASGLFMTMEENAAQHSGATAADLRQRVEALHGAGQGKTEEAYALAGEGAQLEYLAILGSECSLDLLKSYRNAGTWPVKPPRPGQAGSPPLEQALPVSYLLRICVENEAYEALSQLPGDESEMAYDTSIYIPVPPSKYNAPIMAPQGWVPQYAKLQDERNAVRVAEAKASAVPDPGLPVVCGPNEKASFLGNCIPVAPTGAFAKVEKKSSVKPNAEAICEAILDISFQGVSAGGDLSRVAVARQLTGWEEDWESTSQNSIGAQFGKTESGIESELRYKYSKGGNRTEFRYEEKALLGSTIRDGAWSDIESQLQVICDKYEDACDQALLLGVNGGSRVKISDASKANESKCSLSHSRDKRFGKFNTSIDWRSE